MGDIPLTRTRGCELVERPLSASGASPKCLPQRRYVSRDHGRGDRFAPQAEGRAQADGVVADRRQGEAGEGYCSCGAAIRHAGLFQRPCRAASYSGMTVGSRDSIC